MSVSAEDKRLWRFVEPTGFCWNWIGTLTKKGYGDYRGIGGRPRMQAHRAAYLVLVGPLDPRAQLDHLCRNRACVNPDHLVPATNRENVLAGYGPTAENARRTHCIRGHEFTEANTRITPKGGRDCRECKSAASRVYRARKSEGVAA